MVLNLDNDEARRGVEICYRTRKTLVNPIIDWDASEVWEFLNEIAKVPHCKLYDEGLKRLGCIGCPMQGGKGMLKYFEKFPKYKALYLRAFEKMWENSGRNVRIAKYDELSEGMNPKVAAQNIFDWWVGL